MIGCRDIIGFYFIGYGMQSIGACRRILGIDTRTSKVVKIYLKLFCSISVYICHIEILLSFID